MNISIQCLTFCITANIHTTLGGCQKEHYMGQSLGWQVTQYARYSGLSIWPHVCKSHSFCSITGTSQCGCQNVALLLLCNCLPYTTAAENIVLLSSVPAISEQIHCQLRSFIQCTRTNVSFPQVVANCLFSPTGYSGGHFGTASASWTLGLGCKNVKWGKQYCSMN